MSASFELEPVLDAGEIQGNVLGGFNKDLQLFVFLRIPEMEDLGPVRAWLTRCADRLTWLDEVASFKKAYHALTGGKSGADPGPLASTWMNMALSYPALVRLAPDAALFDPVFKQGMPSAVGRLGDPLDAALRGHISQWKFGASGNVPDILLIIAADRDGDLLERLEHEQNQATAAGLVEMHVDRGRDLGRTGASFPSGREHFGFKDGVSQPAVRGRLALNGDFLTPRDNANGSNTSIDYASPGRPLVCPGEFVLGYPRQSVASGREAAEPWPIGEQDASSVLPRPSSGPSWARNGSFLVYRRLNQDVPAFNRFLSETANALAENPEFAGLTPERLGAMVIGRWRSGAPLLRATLEDNDALAKTAGANNDFDFLTDEVASDGFAPAAGDPAGEICPAASHIRKVNPRVLATDQGGEVNSLVRRILRRGIPFGEALPIGSEDDPDNGDRGLLFLCYQASIRDQFEFLQSFWANDDAKPTPQLTGRAGQDLVIGQGRGHERARFMLVGAEQFRIDAPTGVEWVYPSAGAYFFSPSCTAIRQVLGGAATRSSSKLRSRRARSDRVRIRAHR